MMLTNYIKDGVYRLKGRIIPNKPIIYINAYVARKCNHDAIGKNWGDDINYWFLREIIKDEFRLFNESPIAFRLNAPNYLVIGSTISLLSKPNSIIWGAGCIDKSQIPNKPAKVLAVRGPLTRKHLISQDIDCPEIYGDPALLISRHYNSQTTKKYKLGLIHHVSETSFPIKGAKLISMADYENWHDVIDQITECEVIASSSLHGLIIAETYGIPTVWTESKKLLGNHFKFHDFFQSLGTDEKYPIIISPDTDVNHLIKAAKNHGGAAFDLRPLVEASPFTLSLRL